MRLLLLLPPLLLLLPFLLLLLHYEEHKNAVEKNEKGWCEKLEAWCCWMLNADEGVLSWSFACSLVFSFTVVKTTCHEHLRECVCVLWGLKGCPYQCKCLHQHQHHCSLPLATRSARKCWSGGKRQKWQQTFLIFPILFAFFHGPNCFAE